MFRLVKSAPLLSLFPNSAFQTYQTLTVRDFDTSLLGVTRIAQEGVPCMLLTRFSMKLKYIGKEGTPVLHGLCAIPTELYRSTVMALFLPYRTTYIAVLLVGNAIYGGTV